MLTQEEAQLAKRRSTTPGAPQRPRIVRVLALLALAGAMLAALLPGESAAAQATPQAHLLFVGDVMVGRYVNARMQALGLDWPFNGLRSYLSNADLTVGNLEGPIVPLGSYHLPTPAQEEYNLAGDARAAGALARAGFDLLSVANNHSFDAGLWGLQQTVTALQGQSLAALGTDEAATGQAPIIRDVNGLRIAFLAYTAVLPNIGQARQRDKPFVTYLNPASRVQQARFAAEIAEAKRNADVVVVVMHWGVEYVTQPNAVQRQLAELAAQSGADLVVGAHPHVVQGMELRGAANRPTLVAYSLGNGLFDQSLRAETRQGFALDVTLDAAGVKTARLVPLEVRKPSGGHQMQLADDISGQPTLKRAAPSTDPRLLHSNAGVLSISYGR